MGIGQRERRSDIERVETDSDGVYEAHIVTTDGQRLTVEMDETSQSPEPTATAATTSPFQHR